jgi:hypothetical protein
VRRSIPALVLAVLGAAPAAAQELRLLQVPLDLSVGFAEASGDVMQLLGEALPRLELDIGENGSLVLEARLRLDAEEELEPGTPALDSYAPISEPLTLGSAGTLELRDVYWESRFDAGIARLGKQQIVWGRLDGLKVLDVLNPQSFREFIVDDFGDSRISLWSAYVDVFAGAWRVEAAVIPDYTAHEIPEPGAWFELTAPRFRFGAAPGQPALPAVTDRGRSAAEDGALGLRLSRSLGRLDVSAVAYSGSDHEPLGRLRAAQGGAVVERYHERRELFGASVETSLGAFALRAEAALQPSRVFNTRGDGGLATARADQVSAGIAADVDGPLGLLINLQFLWDEILDAPSDLVRPDRDRVATVFLRRSFAYETLGLEARWYHALDDGDDLYRLTLDYDLGDNSSLYLSGDWFTGTSSGLFGQFAARDRIVLGIRHTF